MAMTFQRARELAAQAVGKLSYGTTYASESGREDKRYFAVSVGPEEWLVDRDPSFLPLDPPLVLVNKSNGRCKVTSYASDPDRFAAMRSVQIG